MPENTVYVGRPTRWGNPWQIVPVDDTRFAFSDAADVIGPNGTSLGRFDRIGRGGPHSGAYYWATRQYDADLHAGLIPTITIADVVRELAGRDLACWCPLELPCHADVLLKVANP
jgi:hypothetical protein